jgi:methanethiol S-methyltransferase
MKYFIISVLWSVYCILHSYLISTKFTNFVSRLLRSYYAFYRMFYVIVSIVLLIPLINYENSLDQQVVFTYSPFLTVLRYFLYYGSLVVFFLAFFFNYDSLSFFGIRQILGFRKTANSNTSGEIRKNGLLGVVRHPMYLALIIFLWSQTFRIMDVVVNTILTIYIIIGTLLEERKLVAEFGEAYISYQKEVPMLIPFSGMKNK